MSTVTSDSGRYDRLHGDEPEIQADRDHWRRLRDEWRADEADTEAAVRVQARVFGDLYRALGLSK